MRRIVEHERRIVAPGAEQPVLEAGPGDPLEVDRRDDLVGVHIGAAQRHGRAGVGGELVHGLLSPPHRSAGAASLPTTAVAAATCGETRWVRPPLPCRPSKLRLEVEAARSPGLERVRVHAQAHRAAGEPPLGARLGEDLVQALRLGRLADLARAGHDHHPYAVGDLVAAQHVGGGPQVLQPAVGAGADEDHVDRRRRAAACRACRSMYSRARRAALRSASSTNSSGSGTTASSGAPWPGLVPQVTNGLIAARVEDDLGVVLGALVGGQRPPVRHRGVPLRALRARARGPSGRRRWSRPARSCRPWRPTRWTCCRWSSGPPWRACGWPRRGTPRCGRCRRRCRPG